MRNFAVLIFIFGCSYFEVRSVAGYADPTESPCYNQPNGSHIPDPNNCSNFLLCDNNNDLPLSCRSAKPYFDRCNDTCVDDKSVCSITVCPDESTTTTETSDPTTTTTTAFHPPTVPTECPIACNDSNRPTTCPCAEQWTCNSSTKQCICDNSKVCPMTRAECEVSTDCGCKQRCECESDENCVCNKDLQCPFADVNGACIASCGCQNNCDCTTFDPDGCVCKDECACIEPPLVCPFEKDNCGEKCGCKERCLCNGISCHCDPENGRPV